MEVAGLHWGKEASQKAIGARLPVDWVSVKDVGVKGDGRVEVATTFHALVLLSQLLIFVSLRFRGLFYHLQFKIAVVFEIL